MLPLDQRKIDVHEAIMAALRSFSPDALRCNYFGREHEVVNLYVFGHLVPQFQSRGIPLETLGMEISITSTSLLKGRRKDLVVWPEPRCSRFKGDRPIAVMEWKFIPAKCRDRGALLRAYAVDIAWTKECLSDLGTGYAVILDLQQKEVRCAIIRLGQCEEVTFRD